MSGDVHGVWAIVPVKTFARAKQRLAAVLSAQERAALAEAMLYDVLDALAPVPQLEGIAVVTADPLAAQIAMSFGARHVPDAVESGVNEAVLQGLDAVRSAKSAVTVIAADVPFATPTEIAAALGGLAHDPVLLAPAQADGGTNLLAQRRAGMIEPCFGERSFARHLEQARTRNLRCGVVKAAGLDHDIDRPGDLFAPTGFGANRVTTLLADINVERRLEAIAEQRQSA